MKMTLVNKRLLKKTTIARGILGHLTLIGLVVAGQTAGAWGASPPSSRPALASTLFGSELPVEAGTPGDAAAFDGQSGPGAVVAGSADVLPDPIFDPAESLGPQESVSIDGDIWGASEWGQCCEVCGGGDCCPDSWYTHQEARILARNWPDALGLTYEDAFIGLNSSGDPVYTPRAVLTARSAGFDVAAGYSTTVGHYLGRDSQDRDRFIEFSYWGLNDWRETRTATGERITDGTTFAPDVVTFGTLNSGFDPSTGATSISLPFGTTVPTTTFSSPLAHSVLLRIGGFNRADQQQITYHSDLNNFELNLRLRPRRGPDRLVLHPNGQWRRECRQERFFSYLFGVRVMSIDESFDWISRGRFDVNGAPFSEVSAQYLVRTRNDLVGLQVGADMIYRRCKWSGGFRGKVGPYINFASQSSRGANDAAGDPYAAIPLDFRTNGRKDDVAFVGEFGVVGTYSIRPNLVLRASYDLMWVAGLALASEQITFQTDPPDGIDTYGLNFYQGLSLGFEWIW